MSLSRRLRAETFQSSTLSPRSMVPPDTVANTDRSALALRMRLRSQQVMQTMTVVDAQVDQVAKVELMQWIRDEYAQTYGGMIIGTFARCYLGPPYVDHKLDLLGSILEHYGPNDDPGQPYSNARGLVRSGAYAFVEIYSDGQIVPILPDGTAVSM